MIVDVKELLQQENDARNVLNEVTFAMLMEYSQEAIVSCGASGYDCNGINVGYIQKEAV